MLMAAKEDYDRRKAAEKTAQDKKIAEGWKTKLKDPITLFTGVLAILAFAQWYTLEKTDDTLRAGERAFVFVKQEPNSWTVARKVGDEVTRTFGVIWENNGNSQTRDMKITLWCPRPSIFETVDPITAGKPPVFSDVARLLGPKQYVWGGVCNYSATELEDIKAKKLPWFVAARATYYDIFGKWHRTEYCTVIFNIEGDFKNVNAVRTNDMIGCAAHNCADNECSQP